MEESQWKLTLEILFSTTTTNIEMNAISA